MLIGLQLLVCSCRESYPAQSPHSPAEPAAEMETRDFRNCREDVVAILALDGEGIWRASSEGCQDQLSILLLCR